MEVFSKKHLGFSRSLEAALMATKTIVKPKPRGTFRDILITEVSRKNCQIFGVASGLKCKVISPYRGSNPIPVAAEPVCPTH